MSVNAVPLLATGGAVTVAGLTVGLIAEVLAQRAVTDLQAGRAANLRAIETVEVAAFVAAGVGVVGLGGALLLLGSTADTDASTPMPDYP
jgi:anti-sigma factor RsiW